MLYLLDTCVISDFVKADKNTTLKLMNANPSQLSISTITLMEINYGLEINPAKAKKIKPVIQSFIDSINILPYAEEDAQFTAKIRSDLRKKGLPIASYDVLIAGMETFFLLSEVFNGLDVDEDPNFFGVLGEALFLGD